MVQAIVVAAGGGSRLYPLTDVIPKIMVPVGVEQYPLAHMIVDHCMDHGITDILFCLSENNGKQVMNYLGDGSRLDCKIQYSFSKEPMGTAGEVKLAWEKGMIKTPALIYYGDTLCSTDLTFLIQKHERADADVTITVNDQIRIPTGYVEDDDGVVIRITEKPKLATLNDEIGSGGVLPIFYVEKEDFFLIYCREGYDIMTDILPVMLQNSYKIVAFHDTKEFLDLGNWKNYERAKTWKGREP
jgi:NDP-sugar pyrophosphorylase family protein